MNNFLLFVFSFVQIAVLASDSSGRDLNPKSSTLKGNDIEFYHEAYASCTREAQLDSLNRVFNDKINEATTKTLNLFAYCKALSKRGKSNEALKQLNVLTPYLSKLDDYLYGEYYATIGSINYFSENPQKAYEYLKRSIVYTVKSKNKRALHSRYSSLGIVFLALNDLDSAFLYFEKALSINQYASTKNRLYLELNIALANSSMKNYEAAKHHFTKALRTFEEYPDLFAEVRTYGNLGDIYIGQDSLHKGEMLYLEGLKLAERNSYNLGCIRFHKSLADLYGVQNRIKEAFDHLLIYQTLRDSLSMEETAQKIEEMDMSFKLITEEHEKKSQAQLYKLESQKTSILWVSAVVLILVLSFLYRQLLILKSKNEVLYKLSRNEVSLLEKKEINK